jgi:dipeptidyl aminopeptidase/acylaminoacyl peptidase
MIIRGLFRFIVFLISVSNIATCIVNAQATSEEFTIDHILSIKAPSSITISPDGKWIAYVVSRIDEEKNKSFNQIWMTSVDGEVTIPMTASYTNAGSPQWNPDGSSLGFIGTRGDDEDAKSQVWLLDLRGGEAQQYTHVEQGIEEFLWSPDGRIMLLTIRDPEQKELDDDGKEVKDKKPKPWIIDRLQFKRDYVGYLDSRRTHFYLYNGEGDPVQITSGDYDDSSPEWAPDGSKIAFVSNRDGDPDGSSNSDIWVVSGDPDVDEYPLTQITTNEGSDSSPTWSPDGKLIAHLTVTEPAKLWYATQNLAIASAEGSDVKILTTDFDRMIYRPAFSHDGNSIYFMAENGGNQPVMVINIDGSGLKVVTGGELTVRQFELAKDGRLATIQSSHHMPFEVHISDAGKMKRLTKLNDELLKDVKLARVERLKVPGWNDEEVESFVYYPSDYNSNLKYPTIFVLHGGPVAQHDTSFNTWAQLYAANGYIAVLPNPHGSTGYGGDFTYSLNRQWGVPDFADVDKTADHLVVAGISDGDRLGVGGWSYGGILTNYMITKSSRFKGAVTGASEVNHRANYGHDHYQLQWEIEFGLPWENIEAWEAINPFNDIGKITTPTLVMGGEHDWNVPIQNSEQLYQGLRRLGVDTQLVVYPDEHHGIRLPNFQRDRFERYLEWFNKYVK